MMMMGPRDQLIMQELMGNNLIVVFSSLKSVNGDISKVKAALSLCPAYSRFPVLWILNKQMSKDSHLNPNIDGEKLIREGLLNELQRETLSSLHIVSTYCGPSRVMQPPLKKLKSSLNSAIKSSQSYVDPKNLLLSLVIKDLELALKDFKAFPKIAKPSEEVKLEDIMRNTLIPEAVKLSEGKGDAMKVMR